MHDSLYLVAGLGKTGHSIARYLQRRNKAFVAFDTRTHPASLAEFNAEFPGVDVYLGELPDALYGQLVEIISSPGVALDGACMQKAVAMGIPIVGDIECLAREIKAPVIAITGTNGKSTVTTLVGEMARAAGLSVAVAGNIGLPVLDLLDDGTIYELWVLELSSFQLDLTCSLEPIAATILNISPDHLDRHHSLEAYIDAKQRVYHGARTLIYNRDDTETRPKIVPHSRNQRPAACPRDPGISEDRWIPRSSRGTSSRSDQLSISFGLDHPAEGQWGVVNEKGIDYLAYGKEQVLPVDALRIKGRHNWQNALAASALAQAAGIARQFMVSVLEHFCGLPHRAQWVRTMDGVDWINDSKGTNIGATVSAITGIGGSMQGKIVLIAGGQGKGADFTELRSPIAEYVRSIVLIGADADLLERALTDVVDVIRASSLDAAVIEAKRQAKPGDVVLLSPACASLDMFRDFNHRGDSFTAAVEAL